MARDVSHDELLDLVREFVDEYPEAMVGDIMAEYDLSDIEVFALLDELHDVLAQERQVRDSH